MNNNEIILTDKTINTRSAQYFCMFTDNYIKRFFDNINNEHDVIKCGKYALKQINAGIKSKNQVSEAMFEVGVDAKSAEKSAIAATGAAIDAAEPKINNIANNVTDAAVKKTIDSVNSNKQLFNDIASSSGEHFIKGAIKSISPYAIAIGAVLLGTLSWPFIKNGFKRMMKTSANANNSIAFVKFKDIDNNDWQFYFSIDNMMWKLDNMDSGDTINSNIMIQFMKTKFAIKFINQCKKMLYKYLNDEYSMSVMLTNIKDSSDKKRIENILKYKDLILDQMTI